MQEQLKAKTDDGGPPERDPRTGVNAAANAAERAEKTH